MRLLNHALGILPGFKVITFYNVTIAHGVREILGDAFYPALEKNTYQDSVCHQFAVLIKAFGHSTNCFSELQFLNIEREDAWFVGENLHHEDAWSVGGDAINDCSMRARLPSQLICSSM